MNRHADEPFRYCSFCDADCEVDEPEHAADCPDNTGVYPVRYEECHPVCPHCGKRPDPSIRCSECECLLGLGDFYTHRTSAEADPDESNPFDGVAIYEPICLGCAAKEALT